MSKTLKTRTPLAHVSRIAAASMLVLGITATEAGATPPRGPDFDGDGYDDFAMGNPSDDDTVENGGSVNILYGSSTGPTAPSMRTLFWDQDTSGVRGGAEANDGFGGSLAWGDFDGDCRDDLAIGAGQEDIGSKTAAGAVNVLYGSSNGITASGDDLWHGDASGITAMSATAWDQLGLVAVGNFDDDQYDDLVIAIPGDDEGASRSGSVLVIYGSEDGLDATSHELWNQDSAGMAGDGSEVGDAWGQALVTGDFNCDGFDDLAIGAPWESLSGVSGVEHGAVTIMYGGNWGLSTSGSQFWHQNASGVRGAAEDHDSFGRTLAAGNFSGDSAGGHECVDLAIGAPLEDVGSIVNGAVHVLLGGTSGLSGTGDQLWYHGNGITGTPETNRYFGEELVVGRFNNDGYDDLGIGAHGADVSGNGTGEIYLLLGDSSGLTSTGQVRWDQATSGIPGYTEAGDHFGVAMGFSSMQGWDENPYLLVSAPSENDGTGHLVTLELDAASSSLGIESGTGWWQDDIEGTKAIDDLFATKMPSARLKDRCPE